MVCSFATTTTTTNVFDKFCDGEVSKEVGCCTEGLKPLPEEASVSLGGSAMLDMIQTEEGRAQLNQQQKPLVELLNRKAQKLGLGLTIVSKGFAEPSFIIKAKTSTMCPTPEPQAKLSDDAVAAVNGDESGNEDLLDATKIGEVNPGHNHHQYNDLSDTSSDGTITEVEDEYAVPEPPIKKQRTQSGELHKEAPQDTSAMVQRKRAIRKESLSRGRRKGGNQQQDGGNSGTAAASPLMIFCNLNGRDEAGKGAMSLVVEGLDGVDKTLVVSAC